MSVNIQLDKILKQLDIKQSELRDSIESLKDVLVSKLEGADETVAQSITLDTDGKRLLEVYASATASTTIHLDVSTDGSTWISDYYKWSNVTEVKETYWNGFRYVRLRSDAGGSAGDTITLVLSAK